MKGRRVAFFLVAVTLCEGGPAALLAQTRRGPIPQRAPESLGLPRPDGQRGGRPGTPGSSSPSLGACLRAQPSTTSRALQPEADDTVLLSVLKSWDSGTGTWQVTMDWSGGTTPFTVSYSTDPSFQRGDRTLDMYTSSTTLTVAANSAATLECFAVTDADGVSPSVQGTGSDPYPDIPAPTILQDGKWRGDTVTLNANYLDLMPEENFVGLAAQQVQAGSVTDGGNGFAASASFTVPDDGRGAYAYLSTHGQSPTTAVPFIHLYPRGISAYGNIRSVIYAPPTGHIWVAADGKVDEIDIFEHDPVIVRSITTYTKPYLSQCTTDGRILVVDGVTGVGEIDQINATSGTVTLYANTNDTAHTPNFTRSILPVGVAVDPNGSVGYIADAIYGQDLSTPVRFPQNNSAAITDNYGNWPNWYFPDPCGMEVGLTHQLFMGSAYYWVGNVTASGTTTYWDYDTCDPVTAECYTPNALLMDRDVSTTSYDRCYYNNAPWTMAYNQNAIASLRESAPARNLGADVVALNGWLSVEPLWEYTVSGNAPKPVILNNSNQSYPYPTKYQVADRLVELQVRGWYNVQVHLRLIDPPDTSPYAPAGGWPAKGTQTAVPPYEAYDNDVWNEGYSDFGLTINPDGSSSTMALNVWPGSNGLATFYLKLPYRYAGDNWQLEVTKETAFGNLVLNKIPSYSALFTGWKRVFVEKDRMFRRGNLLDADVSPPPAGQLFLARWDGTTPASNKMYVQGGDQIVVFDTDHPYPGPGTLPYETATISTDPAPNFYDAPKPGGGTKSVLLVYLDHTLAQAYVASPMDFSAGNSAAVGVTHSADGQITDTSTNQINGTHSAFYDTDIRDIQQPFDEAYVDFKAVLSGAGAVPYIPPSIPFYVVGADGGSESTNRFNFQSRWNPHQGAPNCIYLLGCRGKDFTGTDLTAGYTDASAIHYSFIYVETVSTWGTFYSIPSALIKLALRQDTDHEVGHNFLTNFCTNLVKCDDASKHRGKHDYRGWWKYGGTGCPSWHPCLMFPGLSMPPTSTNRFCLEDLLLGDPNCSAPPPYPRQGAIRTLNDPMP